MPRTVGVGLLFLAAFAACTHFGASSSPPADAPGNTAPDGGSSPPGRTTAGTTDSPATPPAAAPPAVSSVTDPPGAPPGGSPPAPPAAKPARPKPSGSASLRTARSAPPKPLPAEPGGPPAAPQAAPSPSQPVAKPPAAPALDLAGLEQRLKDTHAIGLFTKLSLKNQVDDLLGAFSAFHGGKTEPPLADLRQRYDLLLLKVLTLLQDGDPPLASAISASREAIWSLLADRDKFKKIQMG